MCVCKDWTELVLGEGWSVADESVIPSASVDCFGIVYFKGNISGDSGVFAFSIADEFKPGRFITLLVPVIVKDTNLGDYGSVACMTIDVNGTCWISQFYPIRGGEFTNVYLDGVSFRRG